MPPKKIQTLKKKPTVVVNKKGKNKQGSGVNLDTDGNLDIDTSSEIDDVSEEETELEDAENLEEEIDENVGNDEDGDDVGDATDAPEDEPEQGADVLSDSEDKLEDGCLYNISKKAKKDDVSDDEYQEMSFDDDGVKMANNKLTGKDRVTKPFMTKYERVRVLADRAKQLSLGAKPMLKNTSHLNPKDIALAELEMGVVPFKIERPLPNGQIELWKISELKIMR